ncbi:SsgA family sporulation/cell division regulator [Streptomyces nigra]|uniref:SsgA family sporulation/cell division regulator n=1 Tax=Streptomyces nigra TaxID=1827580 RepID=UPI0036C3CF61
MPSTELACTLQLVIAPGRSIPVSACFSYRSRDPYGIHVTFQLEDHPPVSWVFARDLLAEGTVRPSGFGDVRVWPEKGEADSLGLELTSPYGHAQLTMPMDELTAWLGQTYHLVPIGSEEAALNLDGELSRLLGEVS